jgi:peptide chain release factor 1
MKTTITEKLTGLLERSREIEWLLASPDVISDQTKFKALSKEHAEILPIAKSFLVYKDTEETISAMEELAREPDEDMRQLATAELVEAEKRLGELEDQIKKLLLPRDPEDRANVFLEIRAGTGGDEAGLFVGDLLKMYLKYAEEKSWKTQIISSNESEAGGYKEVVTRVSGVEVFYHLKFESGTHRVQRVPETESQGRVHTSACTVAVLPEPDEIEEREIQNSDLRIDTFRASGAGGQHVNKTDSAIRITHLPSGVVVECQDERSQHKNRARAMSILKARLLQSEKEESQAALASTRKTLVGSGDRSERVRTYNYPQGRVTDHRINLTLYKLSELLEGSIDILIEPLLAEHNAELMANLGEE